MKTARAARRFIAGAVALSALSALFTIGFAGNLSLFISGVFTSHRVESYLTAIILVLVFGSCRALVLWLQEFLAVRAAIAAKVELRQSFFAAVNRLGSRWLAGRNISDVALLATHRIDALDAYFSKFLPSLVSTILVTPAIAFAIFTQDFWSGVIVACTLPLIPLFMIFIGLATQDVQRRQLAALNSLANHFTDVLRGLTTLRVFSRLAPQTEVIWRNSEEFRKRTMRVLRMSFLSGLALEVASSLAVAFVAVSIGLRLIDGSVALGPGLMALLLAPEAFLPIRQVGTNFHASNEGVMASSLLLDVIEESGTDAIPEEGMADRFPSGAITHLTGPSGSGKTTLLNRIRRELSASVVTWMPQGSKLLSGSIRRNIIGPASDADPENLKLAVQLAALDDVELDKVVSDSGAGLSGGQVQRVALARAFYRALTRDSDWLLLDEPLSALDAERSNVVQAALQEFAGQGRRVLLSSHKPLTVAVRTLAVEDV